MRLWDILKGHAKPLCTLQEFCFEAAALVLGKLPPSSTSLKPPCLLLVLWLSTAPLLVSASALSACLLLSGFCCSSAASSTDACCGAASRTAEPTPVVSICTGTGQYFGKRMHTHTWPVQQTVCRTHLRRSSGAVDQVQACRRDGKQSPYKLLAHLIMGKGGVGVRDSSYLLVSWPKDGDRQWHRRCRTTQPHAHRSSGSNRPPSPAWQTPRQCILGLAQLSHSIGQGTASARPSNCLRCEAMKVCKHCM